MGYIMAPFWGADWMLAINDSAIYVFSIHLLFSGDIVRIIMSLILLYISTHYAYKYYKNK